ncbi:MAG: hypothetical protein AB1750_04645 [Chloroflexota bacterium]
MSIATYEGVVKKGKIRLQEGARLPENAKVYIVVASVDVKVGDKKRVQVMSPRLKNRKQAARLKLTVTEEKPNAKL